LYVFLICLMQATCPFHLILIGLIILIICSEEYKFWDSPLCNFRQPSITSSILGQNNRIVITTLFSDILNLCSSLYVRDQVSHPCKTTCKIIICIF
jgi:hypothetical protein